MDTSPAFLFIGCKYFRSRTKVNSGQFNRAQSHICQSFLCNYGRGFAAKLSIKEMHGARFLVSRSKVCVPNIKSKFSSVYLASLLDNVSGVCPCSE